MDKKEARPKGRPRMHPDGLTSTVSIALPRSEHVRLERLAQARGVSVSRLLRERLVPGR